MGLFDVHIPKELRLHITIKQEQDTQTIKLLQEIGLSLISINNKIENNMSVVTDQLKAINDQFNKSFKEYNDKIDALQAAINNNQDNLSPETQAALDDLKATAQKFDDANPDETPAPTA